MEKTINCKNHKAYNFRTLRAKSKHKNTKDIIEKITKHNDKRMQNKKGEDNLEDLDFGGMMLTIILLLFALEQEDYLATYS
jgi:hypothetical protein